MKQKVGQVKHYAAKFKWLGLIVVAISFIILLLANSGIFWRAEAHLSDALQGGLAPSPQIVIVGIDESSISALGRYPWDRDVYADVLTKLIEGGAKVVAFDIGFFEPSKERADDEALSTAIKSAIANGSKVVLAEEVVFTDHGIESSSAQLSDESYLLEPLPELQALNISTGYINYFMDWDGVVRTISFGLHPGAKPFVVKIAEAFTGRPVFLPAWHESLIRFVGPPRSFERHSFVDVMNGAEGSEPEQFKDKIVLVGAVASDLHDEFLTPVSAGEAMSGVEIHANALQMVMTRDYTSIAEPKWLYFFFALLGAALFYLSFVLLGKPWSLAITTPIVIIIYLIVVAAQFTSGVLLPIIAPVLALLGSEGAAVGRWVYEQQAEKKKMKSAFAKYVSPEVIKEVMQNPDRLALGGVRRELSILFSDIRGFTSLSEKLKAEELVTLLNDYLTEMTNIILDSRGVVDKYIGDAIMAFWNAPLDEDAHALHACETAVAMVKKLAEKRRAAKKGEANKLYEQLRVGIGIHTGGVVVGNMGSHERFDYTAMGDNVNLASRLEGLTKAYKVGVIVSGETKMQAEKQAKARKKEGNKGKKSSFAFRKLDRVRVKGKKEPVLIYELLPYARKNVKEFEKALELYYKGRFKEAKKCFLAIKDDTTAGIFAERCALLMKEKTLAKNWDGVWTMTTK